MSALSLYTKDLVRQATDGKLDPIIGRDQEMRRIIQVLCRKNKSSALMIGAEGVGKSKIIEGLAHRIVRKDIPDSFPKRLHLLDTAALMGDTQYKGEFEKRMTSLLAEIEEARINQNPIIIAIDELHSFMSAGGLTKGCDIIKPALSRGDLCIVAATTEDEFRIHIQKDAAFERRFSPIHVDEPSVDDTICILRGLKDIYEAHHKCRIDDQAIVTAVQLADRYIKDRQFPDKAIDLIDESASVVRMQIATQPEQIDKLQRQEMQLTVEIKAMQREKSERARKRVTEIESKLYAVRAELGPLVDQYKTEKRQMGERLELKAKLDELKKKLVVAQNEYNLKVVCDLQYTAIPEVIEQLRLLQVYHSEELEETHSTAIVHDLVTESNVLEVLSRMTGVPVSKLNKNDKENLLNLEKKLNAVVVGQEEAIKAISVAIRRSRLGLSDPRRPVGSFLFLGSSGSGKSSLAIALANEIFDSDKNFLRCDMSECLESHSISRLIGTTAGYIGFEEGGFVTNHLSQTPYSVILVDEIEKAHPKVVDIFLQMLDAGRITSGKGKVINCTNCIIIFTSNIGSTLLVQKSQSSSMSQEIKDGVMALVKSSFRPEFLNRLDEISIFNPLNAADFQAILKIQMGQLNQRLRDQHLEISCSPSACEFILEAAGCNPAYGARPLKRYMEKVFLEQIAMFLLQHESTSAAQTTSVSAPPLREGEICEQKKRVMFVDKSSDDTDLKFVISTK